MYEISQIKRKTTCVDVAKRLGLPITRSGDRCVSPMRKGAKNPSSFSVEDDFWYDFGSGEGGDQIDLLAILKHSGDRGAAIRELAHITGVPNIGQESQDWLDYTNQLNARTAFYHSQLTDEDRDYLHSRGLTDEDISRNMIGRVTDGSLRGRLFLPYFQTGGYVCYYATRALPGGSFPENKYMKQKRDEHCQHIPWGLHSLHGDDTLVIAEGYFDALSFEASSYPVISAITGIFSREQIPLVLGIARKFKRVFLVYDNDTTTHAGERFTERMATLLSKNRIPFIVGTVPQPYHDVSEYYAAGHKLQNIIDSGQDGVQYIASTYHNFDDLSRFVYSVARYTKRLKLDELLSFLKKSTDFDPRLLDQLFRGATTAPPETIIADEILKSRQILYVSAVGFYEYSSGVWHRRSDDQIRAYADRAYGEFSTAQRVNAICNLLKTRALQDVAFDRQPVWNFTNGTLELDTGTFREHNPNDYCSIQASYPYDPKATYHAWAKFIQDVTGDDPKQSELLQFIPGYALMSHNNFEKIFVLTGSGGNGKSRYLEVLCQLFGEENVSHVTPRGLLDKFQRILLKNSIINLAGEIKSDVKDAEEYMKLIASGETLSACYKSKDYVSFKPRSKLVYACNGQLASGDTSDGLARRLIIIDFKMRFVDNPDPNDPYQREKNINILDEISSEISSGGVFNWAYEGYKLLNAVGYFTETNDQEELMEEFKRVSNPVLVFYEEFFGENEILEIENKQLYSDYKMWCVESGYRPLPSNMFSKEFKSVSQREYEQYRTNKQRGYRRVTVQPSPQLSPVTEQF